MEIIFDVTFENNYLLVGGERFNIKIQFIQKSLNILSNAVCFEIQLYKKYCCTQLPFH